MKGERMLGKSEGYKREGETVMKIYEKGRRKKVWDKRWTCNKK